MRTDPQSAKVDSQVIYLGLFTLLGFACTKAAHKMFVKLTPDGQLYCLKLLYNLSIDMDIIIGVSHIHSTK